MNKLETLIEILNSEDITYIDSINYSIFFIIIKFLNEDKCRILDIPSKYSFDKLILDDDNKLLDFNLLKNKIDNKTIDCLVGQIYNKFNFKLDFKLENYYKINLILNKLKLININNLEFDIIGTIYELHLKIDTTNTLHDIIQYFTNRQIIKFMIELCDPKMKDDNIETILDPCIGTNSFLSMSIKYLNNQYNNINWNINKQYIYGFDVDNNNINMTLLNLLLETGLTFNDTIIQNDTIRNDYKDIIYKVDVILAGILLNFNNIQYKNCCNRIKSLKMNGTKIDVLLLQLIFQSLNENGRCAIIVHDTIIYNDSKLHIETRKYLIENLNLIKIISLNNNLFSNPFLIQSFPDPFLFQSILLFKNNGKTNKVYHSEIKLINNKLIESDLLKIKYNEIVKHNYNLSIDGYLYKWKNKNWNNKYVYSQKR